MDTRYRPKCCNLIIGYKRGRKTSSVRGRPLALEEQKGPVWCLLMPRTRTLAPNECNNIIFTTLACPARSILHTPQKRTIPKPHTLCPIHTLIYLSKPAPEACTYKREPSGPPTHGIGAGRYQSVASRSSRNGGCRCCHGKDLES